MGQIHNYIEDIGFVSKGASAASSHATISLKVSSFMTVLP